MWYGYFEFVVVFFWITNTSIIFIDLMNTSYKQYQDMFIITFIYEILVYSQSEEEHVGDLRIVLHTLKDCQLYTKLSKCSFWQDFVTSLGYMISRVSIHVDPQKTDVLKHCLSHITLSNIWSFLDFDSHYRFFVEGFSLIAAQFTKLTQK